MQEADFNHFYQKYHGHLFQFLFYMVNDRALAEDLVQEVYIRVLKSYDRFEGKSSEKTWLFSIARNVAIDSFRKQRSLKQRVLGKFNLSIYELSDQKPLPEEIALAKEEIGYLYDCLQLCSIDQRMVIIHRYIHKNSIADTAISLGWSESKVKTTQHRALKRLKKHIQERGMGLPGHASGQ
ncbi:RNA polymerase sigma factor SigX [Bacillus sp. FJAT-29790]|uniref:RNA polymerase sigma factor SigX n=1 Tax=Bacillus sp. FJAT-29790 TaxID=1895002 RepID=UPI001C21100D|nr:RNA polymerase sigma factor SigX [Bacillus sp. FJAT-29790]MBU8880423.1 RNA polymerase sigma factor SigX [Bacillus sp. FJAT-29790]